MTVRSEGVVGRKKTLGEEIDGDLRKVVRESLWIQPDQWQSPDVQSKFENNEIEFANVFPLLSSLNVKVAKHEVNKILAEHEKSKVGRLSKDEFEKLYLSLLAKTEIGGSYMTQVKSTDPEKMVKYPGVQRMQSTDELAAEEPASASGGYHMVKIEDVIWTTNWLNSILAEDAHLKLKTNPIDIKDPQALYERCRDGILLCKLINVAVPKTIDERAMNLNMKKGDIFRESENLELAINSARGIGVKVVNIHPENISKMVPHIVMGLLWQIIRIQLTSEINLKQHPGLVHLLHDNETVEDLLKLSPEQLLLRWMNYQLHKSQYSGKPVSNFGEDIKNSEAYTYLLSVIAPPNTSPPMTLNPLKETDMRRRAEGMLKEADKIKCRAFITADDVTKGNTRLNFAFVANLFNTYPNLDAPTQAVAEESVVEETREERTFRNFINSFGLEPHVNYLYSDLTDGILILRLYDFIRPNTVDWSKITTKFSPNANTSFFQKRANCGFAVALATEPMKFKIVGINGDHINQGNKALTLGIVWQVMRAYTLSILQKLAKSDRPIADKDIIEWVNSKLKSASKKTFLTSFQDQSLSDSMLICDLIDACKPGSIQYNLLKNAVTPEAKMDNARYAISMARKIGARVYALPDDIVETKQKMLMTVFACLMASDLLTGSGQ